MMFLFFGSFLVFYGYCMLFDTFFLIFQNLNFGAQLNATINFFLTILILFVFLLSTGILLMLILSNIIGFNRLFTCLWFNSNENKESIEHYSFIRPEKREYLDIPYELQNQKFRVEEKLI